ncbi:adenylate kinase isoenzyme 1-like isoform X1 [Canis lupus baileyi]|uniref:adenylate kinase isoenzyme 1-like isoform X1 n=2 Tax=Canis lupus familiaris TaxID=9615 RepID=UPI0006B3D314|nr:adenylate kinase isoenzyme 1-like isoform X1 [Canis lupus familiaris]XP_022262851.1 adenylate kinase isoenzyme 1-like isoform X1 [Canis lupus familiaris]XP_025313006.1 adenylate kinase isoenzyme 1 isoform X1 [Canis lupus dingo]XP_025313007.1 adenylate kinase isoenzyme 1 isoform X1 [Canis lupus dingo]XP_038284826.1 adenylate kinase isoenzyme 1-like isoform X1 [Canis lupus familiaris]XP_038284827.1 adenylate kinase isoenzyme 1-like isoform X1 [Canis lupus familiaris]XP_038423504.1 adenylate |eukprot:XP_013977405.1 adenylate kinase isoenzyme 1-like isoform X1 [Canis lupus familiaris]
MGRDHPRAAGGMGLCKSKLPEVGRPLRPQEKDILKSPLIIFVMGGPGCGKGTQCKNMATKYGFRHVGLGQLLRQEARRSTQRGRKIYDIMLQGLLVPTGIILDLISSTMLSHPESRGFLIDGFPRGLKQAKEFERLVSDPRVCKRAVGRAPDIVIVFDCSMDTMVRRVLHRGRVEHRADDCESAIRQRLETYYMLCEPVLTFYQQKNLLCNILAEEAPENIFAKCCSVVESLQ